MSDEMTGCGGEIDTDRIDPDACAAQEARELPSAQTATASAPPPPPRILRDSSQCMGTDETNCDMAVELTTYIGIRAIQAAPMTRGQYNDYRAWETPAGENPADDGYLIVYDDSDGYQSWCPAPQFESRHQAVACDDPGVIASTVERLRRSLARLIGEIQAAG